MKTLTLAAAILVAGILWPTSQASGAGFVALDHPAFGTGSLTLDPATGRKWLDLQHTAGLNLETLLPLLAEGQPFDGFVIARQEDVIEMYFDSGITTLWYVETAPTGSMTEAAYAEVISLLDLVGFTSPRDALYPFARARTLTVLDYGAYAAPLLVVCEHVGNHLCASAPTGRAAVNLYAGLSQASIVSSYAWWLYQPAAAELVPLPPAAGLLCVPAVLMLRRGRRTTA